MLSFVSCDGTQIVFFEDVWQMVRFLELNQYHYRVDNILFFVTKSFSLKLYREDRLVGRLMR